VSIWTLSVILLFSCSDRLSTESESDINGTYGYICYNSVGKCDLDVSFYSNKTGESQETHYDRYGDIISVTTRGFDWSQEGDKAYLRGSSVVVYRDGDSDQNNDWKAEFDRIDGVWFPGNGFSSGYKEYAIKQIAKEVDKARVSECVSWTKTHDDKECIWEINITNKLGKYYDASDYRFGWYEKGYNYPTYTDKKSSIVTLRLRDSKIGMYLASKKNLEAIGSANWSKDQRNAYNAFVKAINEYLAKVGKGNSYGTLILELNGTEYTLDKF